jgi:hypothetical protein
MGIQWYIAKSDTSGTCAGPFSEAQVAAMLKNNQISWADGAWNSGLGSGWRRIMDIPLFRKYQPKLADDSLLSELGGTSATVTTAQSFSSTPSYTPASVPSATSRYGAEAAPTVISSNIHQPGLYKNSPDSESEEDGLWYLNHDGNKIGPLTVEEVCGMLARGKFPGNLTGWTAGMQGWLDLSEIPAFQEFFLTGKLPIGRLEKRKARRRPLVATIEFARVREDDTISPNTYTGICRDISASGMRINTSSVPKKVGMIFELKVDPTHSGGIPYFVARAEVVRIIEKEAFAVRFKDAPRELQDMIQAFVKEWYTKPPVIELETNKP